MKWWLWLPVRVGQAVGVLGPDVPLHTPAAHAASEALHDCLSQCMARIYQEFGASVPAAVAQAKWAPPITDKSLDLPAIAMAMCMK